MNDKPEPLVPAHIDLRKFEFMPLDVQRLLKSDSWIEAADNPYLGHAMVSLWAASWHEVPAGSLPNKARVLARHAHRTLEEFALIAEKALAGWVLCSDGRLYHPVVAEKAIEAWAHKERFKARTSAASAARRKKKGDDDRYDHPAGDRDDARNEQDKDRDQDITPPSPPGGEPVSPVEVLQAKKVARRRARRRLGMNGEGEFSQEFEAFWNAYPNKVGKQVAWQSWERDQMDEFSTTIIRDVARRCREDDRWLRGFAPNPATYLNQRRWNDEILKPKPGFPPAPAHNPGGTSPKAEDTPERKLEGAKSFAQGMVDCGEWTKEQASEYLKPYQEKVASAVA